MTNSRRDSSLRAEARWRYLVATKSADAARATAATPYVAPTQLAVIESAARLAASGASAPEPGALTEQVRALYENSDVPVAEIARLLGINPRTLYKYVQRGGWARRNRLSRGPRDVAPAAPKPLREGLAKGAGGRFVQPCEDTSRARGLKALDPQGAARAEAACRLAAMRSARARDDVAAARAARMAAQAGDRAEWTQQRTRTALERVCDDIRRLCATLAARERKDGVPRRAAALAARLHLAALVALAAPAGLACGGDA